jgi:hypothetical protein
MAWVSIAIDVEAECAEAVADALLERGACSVDVSDAQAGSVAERPIFDEPDERGPRSGAQSRQRAVRRAHRLPASRAGRVRACGLHMLPQIAAHQGGGAGLGPSYASSSSSRFGFRNGCGSCHLV